MEDSIISLVEEKVDGALFRNKSHIIEYAVRTFLGVKNDERI